jgi:hypothetical protein
LPVREGQGVCRGHGCEDGPRHGSCPHDCASVAVTNRTSWVHPPREKRTVTYHRTHPRRWSRSDSVQVEGTACGVNRWLLNRLGQLPLRIGYWSREMWYFRVRMDTNTGVRFFLVLLYSSILDEIQHSGPHTLPNRRVPHDRKSCCVHFVLEERQGKSWVGGRIPHNALSGRPRRSLRAWGELGRGERARKGEEGTRTIVGD